jgi:hypothetical protein
MNRKLFVVAALAAVLVAPAFSWAHENDKTVMGNITKVDGMNLMVKGTDGKEVMVMMDAKTKITSGAKKLDAKTLKIGDRVVASGPESQGMISAETVKLGAAPAAAAKK